MIRERKLAKTIFSAYFKKQTPRYREKVENDKRIHRDVLRTLHNDVDIKVWHNLQKYQFWLKMLEIL